ncbi:TRAP transporter small permease subunit [Chloroflexota bacterium]
MRQSSHDVGYRFIKGIDYITTWAGWLAAFLISAAVILIMYEIVARNLFKAPTLWAFDIGSFILIPIMLLGSSFALLHDRHVCVTLIYSRLSQRKQLILSIVTYVTTLVVFFGTFTLLGWELFMESMITGEHTTFTTIAIPMAIIYIFLPLGGFLLFLQTISKVYKCALALRSREEIYEAEVTSLKG